jgi:hypothetical protein
MSIDAGDEFSWRKRFRYIIVGSEFQSSYFIIFTIASREYDYRDVIRFPHCFTDRKTIPLWEIEIEDNEIEYCLRISEKSQLKTKSFSTLKFSEIKIDKKRPVSKQVFFISLHTHFSLLLTVLAFTDSPTS